jgi:hypothetical protein
VAGLEMIQRRLRLRTIHRRRALLPMHHPRIPSRRAVKSQSPIRSHSAFQGQSVSALRSVNVGLISSSSFRSSSLSSGTATGVSVSSAAVSGPPSARCVSHRHIIITLH